MLEFLYILERKDINMEINTKTVKFIGFLNELAKMSANGIRPFSTATTQDKDVLLYDDKHPIETEKSICIGRHNNIDDILIESLYPLIADYLIDKDHHDIVSTWMQSYILNGVNVVVMAGDGNPWILVTSEKDDDFCIIVENGDWYNA